jgi:hypothetical protein
MVEICDWVFLHSDSEWENEKFVKLISLKNKSDGTFVELLGVQEHMLRISKFVNLKGLLIQIVCNMILFLLFQYFSPDLAGVDFSYYQF